MEIEESEASLVQRLQSGIPEQEEAALLALAARHASPSATDALIQHIQTWIARNGEEQKMSVARVLKQLLDVVAENEREPGQAAELKVCQFIVDWAQKEQKNFLKHKMEVRLANVFYQRGELKKARELTEKVLKEAREVDDKLLLVEAHLLESRLIYETKNWPKAKAALTAAKAATAAIYIQPLLQAELDYTAGMIHMAEKDYAIAYSYFYESFEAFHTQKQTAKASKLFEYLLLAKIMADAGEDATSLLAGRYGIAYGEGNNSTLLMRNMLKAYKEKSVVSLKSVFEENKKDIAADKIISSQTELLFDKLLEQNVVKVVTPYSRIDLEYLTKKLGIEASAVEHKIRQMILDGKLNGTLDQEKNELILFETQEINQSYAASLDILKNMDAVVDALYERSAKLTTG